MNYRILQKLQKLKKEYFAIADLQKIFKQKKEILYVTLNRCVKSGWLLRLKTGLYQLATAPANLEKIANQIYYPSYLSFESALAKYGLISQIPYTLTFATPRRTKHITIAENDIVFRQLKKSLFFGYKPSGGIYLAEPEKALLDQLYLVARGKSKIDLSEMDLKGISKSKLLKFSKRFPPTTQRLVSKIT